MALAHIGSEENVLNSSDIAEVSGVDIVIDGHSHVTLNQKSAGKAHVVSSGKWHCSKCAESVFCHLERSREISAKKG